MTPNFFQAATLKKIWVEATLKKSQVAPYKNLGRFYRVPFKSLLRVQIKRAIILHEPRKESNMVKSCYGKIGCGVLSSVLQNQLLRFL